MTQKKFIRPKEDFCIKELFRNEAVRNRFLSDVLEIPLEDIKCTRLLNTFLRKRTRMQKQGILDVLIELNDDTKVNVELQLAKVKDWDKRQLFYAAKEYTNGFYVSEKYDRIKRMVAISLLDFNLTEREEYHSVYKLQDKKGHVLTDGMEIHIIELKKRLEGTNPVDEWIKFLNVESMEELEQMKSKTKNSGILEAIKELKTINLPEMLQREYTNRLMARADKIAREEYVRDEGKAAGKAEAILQLLEEYGPIPEDLRKKILNEKEELVLSRWLKAAAKSDSIQVFQKAITIEKETSLGNGSNKNPLE